MAIIQNDGTMKIGLVLEGGGMRSLFSEGFFDVMQAEGIAVDGIVGVSAGALFGCNYKSHQPGRGLRYNTRFRSDSRYMGWKSFLRTGNYVSAQFAYHTMPLELDLFDTDTFEADPTEFHLVCTDIEIGQPIYHQVKHVDDTELEWFRATGSMPIVSRPVHINGLSLLDGGMVDCIPLRYFQQQGFDRNIVVLTRPRGYQKKPTRITPLFHLFHPQHPYVAKCMARRHEMYNAQLRYIEEQAQLGNTLLIYPDAPLNIGRTELNADKMRTLYEAGQHKAQSMLDQLHAFVNQRISHL